MVFLAVGHDVAVLQNVEAHEVQTDKVHGVFVKMVIIFLVISVVQLVISSDDVCQLIHDAVEIAGRILCEMDVSEYFTV